MLDYGLMALAVVAIACLVTLRTTLAEVRDMHRILLDLERERRI